VLVTRLPEAESIASPRSHCRNCTHTLAWWENVPLLSWLLLRGRCRNCRAWIGLRYPIIELAIGALWTACWLRFSAPLFSAGLNAAAPHPEANALAQVFGYAILCWMLVALAALDAEYFWLPDWLTLPGIALGLTFTLLLNWSQTPVHRSVAWLSELWPRLLEALISAGLVLGIRLAYWLVRRKEGMGLGDAKLMAMVGAWLGLMAALESFALAIMGATTAALVWLVILAFRGKAREWAKMPLPLGTFICLAALSEIFYPDWPWTAWSGLP
jgi:leader peptidase (prepilin peptidase)/N-methyltransferase